MADHSRCPSCNNMTDYPPIFKLPEPLPRTKLLKKIPIQTSADLGCPFCELICQIWNHEMNRGWREYHDERGHVCQIYIRWQDSGPVKVEFFYLFAKGMKWDDGEVENSRSYVISNPANHTLRSGPEVVIPGWRTLGILELDIGDWVEFVKASLHECLTHRACHEDDRYGRPFVPTRLLHIDTESDKIRLIEMAEYPDITRYAVLSHCWGPSSAGGHCQTTRSNYGFMTDNIPWSHLPATFQNAITVCRAIKMAYLWIDSLCIIQQDKPDWDLESTRMCDYYGNAYLTISGTCSSQSSIPFLRTAKYYPFKPVTLPFQPGGNVQVRRLGKDDNWQIPTEARKDPTSQAPIHDSKPILSRAWVFQENSLSTRVLHFTNEGVLYECRHSLTSESNILTRGTEELFSRIRNWGKAKDDWETKLDHDPYGRWRRCVASYFPLRLTKEDDRLPGLSGLAESKSRQIISLQKVMKSGKSNEAPEPPVYLAGLWKASLPQDLCWRLAGEDGIPSKKCVAPSWSWAALQGEVIHFMVGTKDFVPALEFKESNIMMESPQSRFGKVMQGSSIVVSAPMKAMYLIHTSPALSQSGKIHFLEPGIRGMDETEFFVSVDIAARGTEILGRTEYTEMWEPWTIERLAKPVACMLVGEALGQLHGLILEEMGIEDIGQEDCDGVGKAGQKQRCFKRIGYFRTRRIMHAGKWGDPIREEDKKKVETCRQAFWKGGKEVLKLY